MACFSEPYFCQYSAFKGFENKTISKVADFHAACFVVTVALFIITLKLKPMNGILLNMTSSVCIYRGCCLLFCRCCCSCCCYFLLLPCTLYQRHPTSVFCLVHVTAFFCCKLVGVCSFVHFVLHQHSFFLTAVENVCWYAQTRTLYPLIGLT